MHVFSTYLYPAVLTQSYQSMAHKVVKWKLQCPQFVFVQNGEAGRVGSWRLKRTTGVPHRLATCDQSSRKVSRHGPQFLVIFQLGWEPSRPHPLSIFPLPRNSVTQTEISYVVPPTPVTFFTPPAGLDIVWLAKIGRKVGLIGQPLEWGENGGGWRKLGGRGKKKKRWEGLISKYKTTSLF